MRRSKLRLPALCALMLLGMIPLAGSRSSASSCFMATNETVIYYSDATKTHVVGSCLISNTCTPQRPTGCTGTTSSFVRFTLGPTCERCV